MGATDPNFKSQTISDGEQSYIILSLFMNILKETPELAKNTCSIICKIAQSARILQGATMLSTPMQLPLLIISLLQAMD